MVNKAKSSGIYNGHISSMNSLILISPIPHATKIHNPSGGVVSPIVRLRTIITPKWTGSYPTDKTIGKKIGAKSNMRAIVSMKHPKRSNITLMMSIIIKGVFEILNMISPKAVPAPSAFRIQANVAAPATTILVTSSAVKA